jgi:hypothetical protein
MQISKLIGVLLDYWAAQAEGVDVTWNLRSSPSEWVGRYMEGEYVPYSPSTDWAQGGPVIEREGICVFSYTDCWGAICMPGREDWIDVHRGDEDATGPTPLIAAMRARVARKFGDTVPAV